MARPPMPPDAPRGTVRRTNLAIVLVGLLAGGALAAGIIVTARPVHFRPIPPLKASALPAGVPAAVVAPAPRPNAVVAPAPRPGAVEAPKPPREPTVIACDPPGRHGPRDTPVMMAVEQKDTARLKDLLEQGEPVNQPGLLRETRNLSPLMVAAQKGHEASVQILLEAGANATLAVPRHSEDWPPRGWTALCFARWKRAPGVEQRLVAAGAPPQPGCLLEADFLAAVDALDADEVRRLGPRAGGRLQPSVLDHAVRVGAIQQHAVLMEAVLEVGPRPDDRGGSRRLERSMDEALLNEDVATALVLLKAGAKSPSLVAVAEQGLTALVRLILERGVDPDGEAGARDTPLIAAAEHGHLDTVQALLAAGAEVNRRNRRGETPLQAALRRGHARDGRLVRMLVEAGANVHVTHEGFTPLARAAGGCNPEVVSLLLEKGARWDEARGGGTALYEQALHQASDCDEPRTVRVLQTLREAGVRIREQDVVDKHFIWRVARERPAVGAELRRAGLPAEPPGESAGHRIFLTTEGQEVSRGSGGEATLE